TATVTSDAGPVNEGSVSFVLFDSNGNTVGTATSGTVVNGQARASFVLPGGTPVGSYTILAQYSDSSGSGNFAASSDMSQSLAVIAVPIVNATTVNLTTAS